MIAVKNFCFNEKRRIIAAEKRLVSSTLPLECSSGFPFPFNLNSTFSLFFLTCDQGFVLTFKTLYVRYSAIERHARSRTAGHC